MPVFLSLFVAYRFLCWHFMGMGTIFVRVFYLKIIRIIHPFIKLFLSEPLFFCLPDLTPMFVPTYMPQVILSLNRFMGICIQKLPLIVFLSSTLNLGSYFFANIWPMQSHDYSPPLSERKSSLTLKQAFSSSRSKVAPMAAFR